MKRTIKPATNSTTTTVIYRIIITLGFLLLFVLMLKFPAQSVYYAFTGLTLWFQKMIPALFPFMILSGIMIRMNLTEYFAVVLSPLLKPLFKVSGNGAYCIIMGFLCGFPMGAKVIADLYERNKLTKAEATYLLSFCNNIGPIYFTSFALPVIGFPITLTYLFGMYALPLIYGIILCRLPLSAITKHGSYGTINIYNINTDSKSRSKSNINSSSTGQLLVHIDDAIQSAIESITKLGGYMILFNLLNLIPTMLLPLSTLPICNLLLEITSGISRIGNAHPYIVLTALPFGGLSCMAQTYSIIKGTDLSIGNYFFHKCILTIITALYYVGVFCFLNV